MSRSLAFAVVFTLAASTVCQAQRRSPDPYRILKSEYLQKDLGLTKKQIERIRQYSLQYEGSRALDRPEVARELGISDTQKKQIKSIRDDYGKKRSEYYKLRRTDRKKAREKYNDLLKEYRGLGDKIFGVLSTSQKKKFEQMKGKPFDDRKLYSRPKKKKARPDV